MGNVEFSGLACSSTRIQCRRIIPEYAVLHILGLCFLRSMPRVGSYTVRAGNHG